MEIGVKHMIAKATMATEIAIIAVDAVIADIEKVDSDLTICWYNHDEEQRDNIRQVWISAVVRELMK